MSEITQEFDQYDDNPRCSPEVEAAIEVNQAKQFLDDVGDTYYATPKNWSYMSGLLQSYGVPVTRRNLTLAFNHLSEEGILETSEGPQVTYRTIKMSPEDAGIKKVYAEPVKRYDRNGIAENALLRERPERQEELAGKVIEARMTADAQNRAEAGAPGQPISPDYRPKFRQSLGNLSTVRTGRGNARAVVSSWIEDNNLNIKTDSQEYNKLVAEVLQGKQ